MFITVTVTLSSIEKKISYFNKETLALSEGIFILAGVPGFEPGKCRSQRPMPYRLAIPQLKS